MSVHGTEPLIPIQCFRQVSIPILVPASLHISPNAIDSSHMSLSIVVINNRLLYLFLCVFCVFIDSVLSSGNHPRATALCLPLPGSNGSMACFYPNHIQASSQRRSGTFHRLEEVSIIYPLQMSTITD